VYLTVQWQDSSYSTVVIQKAQRKKVQIQLFKVLLIKKYTSISPMTKWNVEIKGKLN